MPFLRGVSGALPVCVICWDWHGSSALSLLASAGVTRAASPSSYWSPHNGNVSCLHPELMSFFPVWIVFILHAFTSWVSSYEPSESTHQIAPPSVSIPLLLKEDIWHVPSLPGGIMKHSFNIFQRSKKIKAS